MSLSSKKVLPFGNPDADIMLIGEAPGRNEDEAGQPFIGDAGDILFSVLGSVGIIREDCYITNTCNYRPLNNDFKSCIASPQLEEGINEIYEHLSKHKHKIIIFLGGNALRYVAGIKFPITDYQGFPFSFRDNLAIATYHPAAVLWAPSEYAVFDFSLRKAIRLYQNGWNPLELKLKPKADSADFEYVRPFLEDPENIISVDIETIKNTFTITEIGIALGPQEAYTFQPDEYILKGISESPCKKIFQNGLYDISILSKNGFHVQNYYWDTHLAQQTLEPELPRDLYSLANFYTDLPFWHGKDEAYNAIDNIATYQVYIGQLLKFQKRPHLLSRLQWKIDCIELARHISDTGQLKDIERHAEVSAYVAKKKAEAQSVLDYLAGRHVNVNSNHAGGDMQTLLYKDLGLPIKRSPKGAITTDKDALIALITVVKAEVDRSSNKDPLQGALKNFYALKLIRTIRHFEKLEGSYLKARTDSLDRWHSVYSPGGTETSRWNASKYYDNTGLNAQTFPREVLEIE